MNIHDKARALVAQSRTPLDLSTAYSRLAKRRRVYGRTTVKPGEFHAIETPRNVRLPYRDD